MRWSLNNVRLRNKMLIVYFLSVFLPIVLTNVIFYQMTTENVKKQRQQDILRAIEQINNEFRAEIEDAITVSSVFISDYNLNAVLDKDYERLADYINDYNGLIRRILNNYTPVYTSVQSIVVYVDNPTLIRSSGIEYLTDEVRSTDWYQRLAASNSRYPVILRTGSAYGVRDTFSIVRKMNNYENYNNKEKVVKIDLKLSQINQIFHNLNLNGHLYIVNDESGLIEYTTNPEVNWTVEDAYYKDIPFTKGTMEFEMDNPVNYLAGWRIIARIDEQEVFGQVQRSRDFIVILAVINFLFATVVIAWIFRSMNTRLTRIVRHMKKVRNQNFDTIKDHEYRDEIGQLTREFNRMTLRIKNLIDDVYIRDLQKKELELQNRNAQLNALQSQINPHFLFNALETIRMRSLMKNETETAKIIQNMAKILRNSFTWTNDMVTVKQELELINCFLEIQTYRFSGKLQYELHVDEEALTCMIPKMAFLPFVENASIHGIEATKNGGKIDMRIHLAHQKLIFILEDNGVGMSAEVRDRLLSYVHQDVEMGERIGVQNVIYRLRLYYPDRFKFDIQSEPGMGTKIYIEIPADEQRVVPQKDKEL